MSGPTQPCPGCGTPVSPDIKFCGQCGRDLRGAFGAPAPAADPAPAPASHQAPGARGGDKRTMLGMPAVSLAQPAHEGSAGAEPPGAAPQPAPKSDPPPARRPNRTILGMTAPVAAPSPEPEAAPAEPTQPAAPEQTAPKPAPAPNTNRTMLGMPKPDVAAAALGPAPQGGGGGQPERQIPAASNRAMLGMSAHRTSSPPAAPAHPQRERAAVQYMNPPFDDSGSYTPPRRGPSTGVVIAILGVLVILAAVGGAGAYFLFGRDGADVRATVVHGEQGEALQVELAGAPAGTKVRFAGQEAALEGGTARFPLSADALHVGDNQLVIDVVGPNGEVDQSNVTLEVRYRVRADLDALEAEPPSIAIVVDALPGSEVTLDGEALPLDGDGRGRRSYPLPEASSDDAAYTHEVAYRIRLPEGPPAEGTVRTRVPYAQMQLDRPGTDVVTDHESIEIAGAVHPEARVRVDDADVPVNDGRFVHSYPLAEPGTYEPRILVRQAGRAPRVTTIRIRRVEDMAAEAARFEPDPGMSYARIQQNPSIYRGQRIALEGRVYNVNVEGGRSDIQILVRDCPRGQRCPLWVSYPAATEFTNNDWVRVLGTVGGEQQFRSETNRVMTVPRIDAQFVLPLER